MDMAGNISAYRAEASREPYLFAIGHGVDDYIEKLYKIINRIKIRPTIGAITSNGPDQYYACR